jgi:hypothetical protein
MPAAAGTAAVVPPWKIHPALTEERLRTVAGIIRDVREGALALYDPQAGDIPWSHGCVVYARTLRALERAALREEYRGWLHVVERQGLHFVFGIGGIPVRVYSGDPERLPDRALRRRAAEVDQMAFAFELFPGAPAAVNAAALEDCFLRLAVELTPTLAVWRISLVLADDAGRVHAQWEVPLDGGTGVLAFDPRETRTPGVVLPPPTIGAARGADRSADAGAGRQSA